MSTETEKTTPNVAQQAIADADKAKAGEAPAADAAATAAATPKVDTAFASEDAQLAELEAKLAAEKAAAPGGAAAAPAEAGAAAQPAAAGATAGQGVVQANEKAAAAIKSTETAAIIALRKQNRELANQNLVLTGQVQALSGVVDPKRHAAGTGEAGGQAQGAGEGQTYEQALETIDQQLLQIAEKVDKGELTMAQYQQQERALRKQERELLEQRNEEMLATAGANAGPTNDLGLQEHLTKLVTDFPFLNELSRADLEPYEALVYRAAEREGKPIPDGPLGSKILRERMAELAERDYAPAAHAARVAARAAAAGGQGAQGQPGGPTGAKPGQAQQPTAAQREAKLAQAGNMPPDISKIGAGAPAGELTEAQGEAALNALRDEDSAIKWLEQHPQFVQKVAGKSFRINAK